LSNGLFQDT